MTSLLRVRDTSANVVGSRGSRNARKSRSRKPPQVIATVIVWTSVAYFLVPLLWLFFAATKSNSDLFTTFGLWFGERNQLVMNIKQTLTYNDGIFLRWLANSFGYSLLSAVGAAALATMAGYALAKYRFPGRDMVNIFVIGAIMVPSTALAIPTFLVFSKIGLTNNPLAVILPGMVSPFAVYLMREYSRQAVDYSLLEAARIDGAGEFRIFRTISLPLLAPGISAVLLLTSVAAFNNYFFPLIMLSDNKLYTVTVGLAQWNSMGGSNGASTIAFFPMLMAGSVIATIPLILAFIFLQKFWQSGLANGAVKE
jgi:multiple sugar transport system permease protein